MKINTKSSPNYIFISLIFYLTLAPQGFPSGTEEFFKKYRELRSKVSVLVGEFTQKNIYPDEIYTTTGKVIYIKPDRLVFSTKDPEKITILDGKKLYEYEVEIKQLAIYDLADQVDIEIFFIAFTEDIEKLKDRYKVSMITVDDERGKDGISIKPLDECEKEVTFKEILIFLRKEDYLPYRIRMVNSDDVQTIVDFEKIETNCKISPRETQVCVPKGTTVVVNDKLIETVEENEKCLPEPAKIHTEFTSPSEQKKENHTGEKKSYSDGIISEKNLPPSQFNEKR